MDYTCLLLFVIALAINSVGGSNPDFAQWQTKIEEKISSLENENKQLKHRVDGLENLLKESEAERIRIGDILKSQQENMRDFDNLQQEQEYPKNQNELYANKETNSTTYREYGSGSENAEHRMQRIVPPTTQTITEVVTFYSYMSQHSSTNLPAHHILQFDVNSVNKGNGYHVDNGIFEAPRAGTYVFLWSIYTYPRGYVSTELVVNGNVIGGAMADSHPDDGIMSGTGVAMAELSAGDHVYVRLAANVINYIFSVSNGRSVFCGWLLH